MAGYVMWPRIDMTSWLPDEAVEHLQNPKMFFLLIQLVMAN